MFEDDEKYSTCVHDVWDKYIYPKEDWVARSIKRDEDWTPRSCEIAYLKRGGLHHNRGGTLKIIGVTGRCNRVGRRILSVHHERAQPSVMTRSERALEDWPLSRKMLDSMKVTWTMWQHHGKLWNTDQEKS